jgi:hypothetical protein
MKCTRQRCHDAPTNTASIAAFRQVMIGDDELHAVEPSGS